MRCPKCHYISFGSAERCRNCGYEFSLAPEVKPVDLPIQNPDQPEGPLGDFVLAERPPSQPGAPASAGDTSGSTVRRFPGTSRMDLPLFAERAAAADDAPLVSPSAVPRPPLSVRRAAPSPVRARLDRLTSGVTRESGSDQRESSDDELHSAFRAESELVAGRHEVFDVAPIGGRLLAGIIDVLVIAAIDGTVLFFTLRLLELTFADIRLLPPVPLGVFLLLLNGGYLSTFTAAGGQTIGKMIAGIKVVTQPSETDGAGSGRGRVTLGSAVLRATAYLVSLLPAGLGFMPILFAGDGRALHDRLAGTRVVKA